MEGTMNQETQHDLGVSLLVFLLSAKKEMVGMGAEFDLTGMQAMTLLLTDNDHPRSMNSFTKLYVCDASNVTGIIDGLEHKGLVSRQNHPKDRRVKVIHLEPAGIKLRKQLLTRLNKAWDNLFAPLSSEEKEAVISSMYRLGRNELSVNCSEGALS
jgi:DNA-binding MarR family transcriptional regulator